MSSLDDRAKTFENKFAHDQEVKFKVISRRNKLLGEWAADTMQYDNEKKERYVKEVVQAGVNISDEAKVVEKISGDFEREGVEVDSREIARQLANFYDKAIQDFQEK